MDKKIVLHEIVDEEVILTGKAADSKSGAAVVVDGHVIYVCSLTRWQPGFCGEDVTVAGRLTLRKLIPDAVVAEDGAISQGAAGDQWVIEHPVWRKSTPP